MRRPRIGFLGTGWIGRHRMAAMIATGTIQAVAVADPDAEAAAAAAALADDVAIVPDLEALLGLGLDGIAIATPSARHAAEAIAALDAGVAVFCQKPLGRTADEARAAVAAAARADRLLSVDFSYRFTQAMQRIAACVRGGDLGHVYAADLVFHNAYGPDKPWFYDAAQSGGGCVIDLGVHLIDLALWLFDFPEVTDVAAQCFAGGVPVYGRGGAVEDYAVAQIALATGASLRLACSWRLHAGQDAVIGAAFHGTEGGAALRNVDDSFYDFVAETARGTARGPLAGPPDDWGGRAAAHWARRVAAGEGHDPASEQCVRVAEVVDRIYAG